MFLSRQELPVFETRTNLVLTPSQLSFHDIHTDILLPGHTALGTNGLSTVGTVGLPTV